jgi:flagellar biosynthetic protein FliQ
MTEAAVLEIGQYALRVALMVAAPLLLASLAVGIMVSIVQVATSLQDATMTFVPKIFAVGLALFLIGPWMLRVLVECARRILTSVPGVVG